MSAVTLHSVPETDRPRLAVLYGAYCAGLGVSPTHKDRYFPLYWVEAGRTPLWVRHDDTDIGFALVRALAPSVYELAEFSILPKHRRRGLGRCAANAIFTTFPGEWTVSVLQSNPAAQAFWHRVFARPPDDPGPPPGYRFKTRIESNRHARPLV